SAPAQASWPTRCRPSNWTKPGPRRAACWRRCSRRPCPARYPERMGFRIGRDENMAAGGRGKRILLTMFVLCLLVAGAVAFWGWWHYTAFTDAPLAGLGADRTLQVERGDSFKRVLTRLR